jgi:cobalt-zinc-cadmium efflux system membrane fusion protein
MKKYIVLSTIIFFTFCGAGNKTPSADTHTQDSGSQQDGRGKMTEGEEHEHQGEHEEHLELHLSADKQKEWGIVLDSVSLQSISSRLTLPGVLTVNQNRTAQISSFVQGKVVSYSVDLGDRIRKGQPLVIINSPEFAQAQADFLRARSKYLLSQKEYERAKMLLAEKAIEEKEYLRREAEYEKLATEYGALGSALHSYGITHEQIDELIEKCKSVEEKKYKCEIADPNLTLYSPVSGTVIFRDVVVGEHVSSTRILYTVSDLKTLWAILDVYEKDLPFINKNSKVVISSSIYPGKNFQGKITYISDLIDEKLRTVKIRVEVDNADGFLKPNMYIQGTVENPREQKDILAIPEEAIQNLEGEKIVFVLEEGDTFAVRHIKLGNRVGDNRIIEQGLEPGDSIVVKGAFQLKAELSKATFGHTHVH